ncbi:MAG TPA: GGDEF domain-containing protein [Solirubrobacterales bacterium]
MDRGLFEEYRAARAGHASLTRVEEAKERSREAEVWDALADRRDGEAEERDRAAERRDREVVSIEAATAAAAMDREQAANDRRLAARDRARAAVERRQALGALHDAQFDDLTGAHRRGAGEEALRAEIERARRADGRLVLALVDVDGLKQVNDTDGHLAGDALLRDLVAAIRGNARSYEPVIRLGGDEFAFAIGGIDSDDMGERCTVIRADFARRPNGGSFTVGVAELGPEDGLSDLLERADAALIDARSRRAAIG